MFDVDVDEVEWKKKENKRRWAKWAPWKKLGAAAYCHLFDIDN
jgi:hypothetical protein